MTKESFLTERNVRDQLMMDEMSILQSRCIALEIALKNFLQKAHYECLDGITECDHNGNVCFCSYHEALNHALRLLGRI